MRPERTKWIGPINNLAHKESDPNLNKQNQPLVVILFFLKKKLILAQYIIKPGLNQVSKWPKILLRFKLKIKWNLTSNLDNLIYKSISWSTNKTGLYFKNNDTLIILINPSYPNQPIQAIAIGQVLQPRNISFYFRLSFRYFTVFFLLFFSRRIFSSFWLRTSRARIKWKILGFKPIKLAGYIGQFILPEICWRVWSICGCAEFTPSSISFHNYSNIFLLFSWKVSKRTLRVSAWRPWDRIPVKIASWKKFNFFKKQSMATKLNGAELWRKIISWWNDRRFSMLEI